jgi:transposase
MKRRRYSNEFKEEVIRLVLDSIPEKSMYQVSKEVGVSYATVCKWVNAYRSKTDPFKMEGTPSMQEEIRSLQKELRRVSMERDILKKAASIFMKELP